MYGQAERKETPSTLIPDVDNAAVGNTFALLQEDTAKGILLFLFQKTGRRLSCLHEPTFAGCKNMGALKGNPRNMAEIVFSSLADLPFCSSFEKGGNVIHICGGLRGSALSLVDQRWEAVFRRERMP